MFRTKNPYGVKVTGDGFGVSFTTMVVLSLTTTSWLELWAWAAAGTTASSAAAPSAEMLLIGVTPSGGRGVPGWASAEAVVFPSTSKGAHRNCIATLLWIPPAKSTHIG